VSRVFARRVPGRKNWSQTHARRRGGGALARPVRGECSAASVVTRLLGTWGAAHAVAGERMSQPALAFSSFGGGSISLPKPRESTAISVDLKGPVAALEPIDLQALLQTHPDFAHNSGR
jgi:hypothetical protein